MNVASKDVGRRVVEYPAAHMRVLGPPGSGKTTLLIERYRNLGERGATRRIRKMPVEAGVFILTYSSESHKRLTDAVFDRNTARLGPPPVVTYSRLAQEIVERSRGRPIPVITELEEHLLLQRVIRECESRLRSDLRSICGSERFGQDALEACHILLQNRIAGVALARVKDLASGNPELSDVIVVYDTFRNALESRGVATYYDIAWRAVEFCRGGPCNHPVAKAAAILVEDFQDVDAGQFELLRAIAPPGGAVAVNVFGDPMGSVFARRGTQHGYLMKEFPRLYGGETFFLAARAREGGTPAPTLEALLEETMGEESARHVPVAIDDDGGGAGEERAGTPEARAAGEFHVEKVRDELDEVYAVAARISALLRTGAHREDEIAIVTNDRRRYEPLLVAAAAQRGIPLETGRVRKRVFGDFIDALLALVESPGDEIASRAILTSPLLRHLMQGTNASDAPAPHAARIAASTAATGAAENRLAFVDDVRKEIDESDPRRWMRVVSDRCLRPIAAGISAENGDESLFHDISRYLEWWERYVDAVSAWGGRPSIGSFAALDAILTRRRSTDAAGSVAFLSCREAKGRYFPAVFVLGCAELLFPSAGRTDNVLPMVALEELLQALSGDGPVEVYRARSAARRLAEEHHLLYVALTRSRAYLHVTAPGMFSGEEYPAPSSALERTVPPGAYCSTGTELKTPPQIRFASVWTGLESVPATDPRLGALSPAASQWHAQADLERPVPIAPFPLSKSSLETYLKCARKFFYQKVLGVPQEESPAATVGLLLHRVMAALGQRFTSRAALVSGATSEMLRRLIDEEIRRMETVGRGSFYDRSLRHHLEAMVTRIIDLERSDGEDRAIAAVEQPLPFSVGPWEFTGRIDRIDETLTGEKFLIDYKTGKFDKTGKTLRKKILYALDEPVEANWQVPFYVWAVRSGADRVPRAFTHVVSPAGEDPFAVTLFMGRGENDIPADALKLKSYLLEPEIEAIIEKAADIAADIFNPRNRFEKTEDRQACRTCDFKRLCGREER